MSGNHAHVDAAGYLLVASVVVPGDLDATRRMLRGLVLPGQRRVHMKDENDARRRSIASAVAVSGMTATIYDAGYRDTLRYEHRRAASELLLAAPDAVAWCWAKGGGWRRRVESVVAEVRKV